MHTLNILALSGTVNFLYQLFKLVINVMTCHFLIVFVCRYH